MSVTYQRKRVKPATDKTTARLPSPAPTARAPSPWLSPARSLPLAGAVQRKVTMGQSGDRHEREADQMADRVASGESRAVEPLTPVSAGVQRQEESGPGEEVQSAAAGAQSEVKEDRNPAPAVQRQAEEGGGEAEAGGGGAEAEGGGPEGETGGPEAEGGGAGGETERGGEGGGPEGGAEEQPEGRAEGGGPEGGAEGGAEAKAEGGETGAEEETEGSAEGGAGAEERSEEGGEAAGGGGGEGGETVQSAELPEQTDRDRHEITVQHKGKDEAEEHRAQRKGEDEKEEHRVQRKGKDEKEEHHVQRKGKDEKEEGHIQHTGGPEEKVRRQAEDESKVQTKTEAPGVTPSGIERERMSAVAAEAIRNRGAGAPLPVEVRRRLEPYFGVDFSDVRLHSDGRAQQAVHGLKAKAFTNRNQIWLGAGQRSNDLKLLAHELAHVVQQGAAGPLARAAVRGPVAPAAVRVTPGSGATPSAAPRSGPGPVVQRRSLWSYARSVGGAIVSGARAVGRAAGRVIEGAMEMARDALMAVVREIAPDFADLIERDGITGVVRNLFSRGFQALFGGVLDAIRGLVNFNPLIARIRGAIGAVSTVLGMIGRNDCSGLRSAASRVAQFFDRTFGPVIRRVRSIAGRVSGFFSGIWETIGVPVMDFLKKVGGAVWDGIRKLISKIGDIFSAIKSAIGGAWQRIKGWFGITADEGSGEGGGIWNWIKEKAGRIWDGIKAAAEPAMGPLRTVGTVLLALSPAGPVLGVIAAWPHLKRAFQWVRQKWQDMNLVVRARNYIANTLIPTLNRALTAVGDGLQQAAEWVADTTQQIDGALGRAISAVGGSVILAPVRALVGFLSRQFRRLAQGFGGALRGVVSRLRGVFSRVIAFLRPIWEVLKKVIAIVVNPFGIPGLVLGSLWKLIPNCLKGPLINFILRVLIRFIRAMPSLLPMLGLLWPVIKQGILGFLNRMLRFATERKVRVSNKIANIISGGSFGFAIGFLKGVAIGLWEGIIGPFLAIRDLFRLPGLIRDFIRQLGERLRQFIDEARRIITIVSERAGDTVQTVISHARDLIEHPGKIVTLIRTAVAAALRAVYSLGGQIASQMMSIFEQPDEALGEMLGNLVGSSSVNVVLSYFTAGGAAAGSAISRVASILARVARRILPIVRRVLAYFPRFLSFVQKIGRLFARARSAAGGFLQRILSFFRRVMSALRGMLGRAGRAIRRGVTGVGRRLRTVAARVRAGLRALGRRFWRTRLGRWLRGLRARFWRSRLGRWLRRRINEHRRRRARENLLWREFKSTLRGRLASYRRTGITRSALRGLVRSVAAGFRRVVGLWFTRRWQAYWRIVVHRKGLTVQFFRPIVLMDRASRWMAGRRAIRRFLRRLRARELPTLNSQLRRFQLRYRYTSLHARHDEARKKWIVEGAMSPDEPIASKDDVEGLHYGTSADPIPIQWYKRPQDYPAAISLYLTSLSHVKQEVPLAGRTTVEADGQTRVLGVAGSNLVSTGTKLTRGSVHARGGVVQREFRDFVRKAGYSRLGGKDADHVKDLGMGGVDWYTNVWPLNAGVNRRAWGWTGWYRSYRIEYKDAHDNREVKPMSAMGGKIFRVIGFRHPPSPNPGGKD